MLEYIAPLGVGSCIGCHDDITRTVNENQVALVKEDVTTTADEVNSSVDIAIFQIGALTSHVGVLTGLHRHILQHGLITSCNCYAHTLEAILLREVGVVADGHILQVDTSTITQVQGRRSDTVGSTLDDDTVLALADERHVIDVVPVVNLQRYVVLVGAFQRAVGVVAVLQEDGLAGGISRLVRHL